MRPSQKRLPSQFRHPLFFIMIALLLMGAPVNDIIAQQADDDDAEAREVYEELDRRLRSVVYETATLSMSIVDSRGRTRERELDIWTFSGDDTRKSLIRFNAPADVRGTGLLTISEGDSEVQRLFLPALNRIQTIGASQRSDRFLGSDFTFEDLGDQNPDSFDFSVVERDRDRQRMKVRGNRTDSGAGYDHAVFTIDTERYILLAARYYDNQGKALRELTSDNITEIKDGIWRAEKLIMTDLRENRYTVLEWKARTIDEPIADVTFTERFLQRGR